MNGSQDTPRNHGPWRILRRHEIYRDPWVTLTKDDVIRPDGKPGTYSVLQLKRGVCVIAVDEAKHVYLTEEFHYGVGRTTLEAASGGCEPDEDLLVAAQRELREETGIEADRWTSFGSVDPFTANVVSPTALFVAEGLRFGPQQPEGTELIRVVRMPLHEAVSAVLEGRITHSPTAVLLLRLHIAA